MLSRLVITFLPRSLLISWLQSPSAVILEPKSDTVSTVSPSISHEGMGPDAMILVFEYWVLRQLFHSLSLSSGGSLVPSCFLPLEWYNLHIWSCWYFQSITVTFSIQPKLGATCCQWQLPKYSLSVSRWNMFLVLTYPKIIMKVNYLSNTFSDFYNTYTWHPSTDNSLD